MDNPVRFCSAVLSCNETNKMKNFRHFYGFWHFAWLFNNWLSIVVLILRFFLSLQMKKFDLQSIITAPQNTYAIIQY